MNESKVDVSISEVLNYKPVIVWSWWNNVDCSDNTLNETKFKISLLWFLKFNVTGEWVPRPLGEGLDDCYSKCLVVSRDREEPMHFSKEET